MTKVIRFEHQHIPELAIFLQRFFSQASHERLTKILDNPDHGSEEYPFGYLIFDEKSGIGGFTSCYKSTLYLQQQEITGIYTGSICSAEGCNRYIPDFFIDLFALPHQINYANTANQKAVNLFKRMRFLPGNTSCGEIHYAILDWRAFGFEILAKIRPAAKIPVSLRKLLCAPLVLLNCFSVGARTTVKMVKTINDDDFMPFHQTLVIGNSGLMSSRHPDILRWKFAADMATGRTVLLVERNTEGQIAGYIAIYRLTESVTGKGRFIIKDWIAVNHDPMVLARLLRQAKTTVRKLNGYLLELHGFPEFIRGVVQQALPYRRKTPSNYFIYKPMNKAFAEQFAAVKDKSWFFGPFDGDRA